VQIIRGMYKVLMGMLIVLLYSCATETSSGEERFSECLYEAPTPIFSGALPSVQQHRFKITAATGIEQITFSSGLELDLFQKGCDVLEQDFHFKTREAATSLTDAELAEKAGEYFFFLGTLDEAYLPLYEWGRLIKENATELRLNTPFEVYSGFMVTLKSFRKKGFSVLEVRLSQVS